MNSEAVEVAEAGLKKYPNDRELKESLSMVLGCVGRQEERIALRREFAATEPDDPNNWDEIGRAYLELGMPDSADAAFDRALAIDPDFVMSDEGKAQAQAGRGNNAEAARELMRIAGSADSQYVKGVATGVRFGSYGALQILAASGQCGRALAIRDSVQGNLEVIAGGSYVANFFSHEPDVRQSLVSALGDARAKFKEADSPERQQGARGGIVIAAIALDSAEVARPHFEAIQGPAWKDKSLNYFWPFLCAQFALADGRAQDALDLFQMTEKMGIRRNDSLFIIHQSGLARAYRMLGRYDEAAATLRELHRVNRSHWLAQYELGQVYQDMGRRNDAIAAYKTFLDGWANADEGLTQLVDARHRLAALQRRTP